MTSLAAEKIETLLGLDSCFICADNLGCNLEPRASPWPAASSGGAGSAGPRGGRQAMTMRLAMPRAFPTA